MNTASRLHMPFIAQKGTSASYLMWALGHKATRSACFLPALPHTARGGLTRPVAARPPLSVPAFPTLDPAQISLTSSPPVRAYCITSTCTIGQCSLPRPVAWRSAAATPGSHPTPLSSAHQPEGHARHPPRRPAWSHRSPRLGYPHGAARPARPRARRAARRPAAPPARPRPRPVRPPRPPRRRPARAGCPARRRMRPPSPPPPALRLAKQCQQECENCSQQQRSITALPARVSSQFQPVQVAGRTVACTPFFGLQGMPHFMHGWVDQHIENRHY